MLVFPLILPAPFADAFALLGGGRSRSHVFIRLQGRYNAPYSLHPCYPSDTAGGEWLGIACWAHLPQYLVTSHSPFLLGLQKTTSIERHVDGGCDIIEATAAEETSGAAAGRL